MLLINKDEKKAKRKRKSTMPYYGELGMYCSLSTIGCSVIVTNNSYLQFLVK